MKLGHVQLPVSDPLKSLQFYTEVLSFDLVDNQGDRFIWLQLGSLRLLLCPGERSTAAPLEGGINVVFYTHDLAGDVERLHGRGLETQKIGNCFHFQDLDGHWFQLVSPSDDHST